MANHIELRNTVGTSETQISNNTLLFTLKMSYTFHFH